VRPAEFVRTLREALLLRAVERSGRFIVGPRRPCWHCGQPTRFVEVAFEAPLHPGACEEAKDREYWDALAEQHRQDQQRGQG